MKRVLVIGATGDLGKHILGQLQKRNYFIRALVRNKETIGGIKEIVDEIIIGDASKPKTLHQICENIDIVLSALGKSISLFSQDDKTFFEVDYIANKNIIDKAKESGVKQFIYISIYGSNIYRDFELARVHRHIEKELLDSEMSYTIIRPVGMFSGLLDILRMAKNGAVITVGNGENKTNPIHEQDLAAFCVDHLEDHQQILEVGGPVIYKRNQIAEIAIEAVGNAQHIYIPEILAQGVLPFTKFYDQNFFAKLAFFNNVLTTDVVAPQYGYNRLEDYFKKMANKMDEN